MSDNDKIGQARRALAFCLKSLAPEDRFAVVDFSTTARSFRPDLTPAAAEKVAAAVEYVQGLQARGGTNIQEALTTALKMGGRGERPYFVVFLTDGLPTMGEEDPKALSDMVRKLASDRVRLFTFGVGHDVNAVLLDRLAEDNRGDRAYVAPGEDMELKVSSFYTKISCPMLSDVKVSLAKANTYDEFPRQAPDLFRGSQISVVGRYRSPGPVAIQVSGKVNGQPREFTFEATLADSDRTHDFLPRLWAVRKVGWLLDEIRLRGEKAELKDEVVRLSKEHGILTPYTSYLVTEDSPRGPRAPRPLPEVVFREVRERRAAAAKGAAASTLEAQVGAGAVAASRDVQALRAGDAEAAETAWLGKERDAAVRQVGDRTFYFDGVRWVVSAYDGKQETKKVAYFSDEYFQLIRRHPALARAFALGDRVIAELDGVFYEVVE
jgi:Ca-activated chloride channel family protein